jgi:hypothetical protein
MAFPRKSVVRPAKYSAAIGRKSAVVAQAISFFFLFDDDFHRVEVAGLARSGHGQWRDDRKIFRLVPGHC